MYVPAAHTAGKLRFTAKEAGMHVKYGLILLRSATHLFRESRAL